ncbi:MAG: wax ester/triacylglycerol synthase family O-acyltransferase [Pseudomonadales bacterium]
MQRLSGADAIFLYRETPASLMHTLKVHIVKVTNPEARYEELHEKLKQNLCAIPELRKRIMPVPFGIHHPVMVDDPDFDVGAHIFRAALPAPGTMRELDDMVAQIGSTMLDRSRPLWEMWVLEGLDSGHIAVVHKIHHAMADGMAYVGFANKGWLADVTSDDNPLPPAPPLPSGRRLLWDASIDHLKHDIWNLWPILKSFTGNLRELSRLSKASEEPRVNPLTAEFPRTRFNYALGVKRSFSSCQFALSDVKDLKNKLGVTLNDVVLGIVAGALRSYFIDHNELPNAPLNISVPVGTDEPGSERLMGNRTTTLFTLLHVQIEDPLERLYAIKAQTEQGKQDLAVFGKHQWGDLMEYVPPNLASWSCNRNFRLKPTNKPNFKPNCNLAVSNVPGPRKMLGNSDGELVALYSAGVLGEGMGLNVTLWSYVDQLNVGALACHKAMPDLRRLTDAMTEALKELQVAADQLKSA